MVSTATPDERLYDASLRQGQVKHALKTALACCPATCNPQKSWPRYFCNAEVPACRYL